MVTKTLPPPSPPLVPKPQQLSEGVTLLPPLSRRGTGPPLILIVPDSEAAQIKILDGVPSPAIKWAEESFTVAQITTPTLLSRGTEVLGEACEALQRCAQCKPKDSIAFVIYDASAWEQAASYIKASEASGAAVSYADAEAAESLPRTAFPLIRHLSGKSSSKLERSDTALAYDYPTAASSFAVPFQPSFSYATESVSHTRNLSFLKKHLDGPTFDLAAIWEEHTRLEFVDRNVEETMATMVQEPYVNHVPTITGGVGQEPLTDFYRHHFVYGNPEDTELELISRTVGIDRVVDEFVFRFTHDKVIDWLIPGIPPTGRYLEIPFTAIINIRGDRLYHEHIAWDQGTVLKQLGLMPDYLPFPYDLPGGKKPSEGKRFEVKVPVAGVETANKLRDKNSVPSNALFDGGIREV